jgi:thiol-disulfide isomerase/thioredoxin
MGVVVEKIDIYDNPILVKDLVGVRSVPTLIVFENGEEKSRLSGETNIVEFLLDKQ